MITSATARPAVADVLIERLTFSLESTGIGVNAVTGAQLYIDTTGVDRLSLGVAFSKAGATSAVIEAKSSMGLGAPESFASAQTLSDATRRRTAIDVADVPSVVLEITTAGAGGERAEVIAYGYRLRS